MIEITYDPKLGKSVPDGKVQSWVETFISDALTHNVKACKVGSELMIHAIRLAIKQGKLDHNDVVFVFEGEEIKSDKDGRMFHWPLGFCDHYESFLSKLLEWDK